MTDKKAPLLAVGGENLIDHVTSEGTVSAKPGGSPFNVAMALGRQEAKVHYISPISTDSWGDTLAQTLIASGVELAGGRRDAPTTMARVTVTDGIPEYAFERDNTAERDITAASVAASVEPVDCLHSGSLAVTEGPDAAIWEEAMVQAYDEGRFVSLDPNLRLSMVQDQDAYRARLVRMFAKVDLLKLSDEDLEGLFPDMDEQAAIEKILAATSAKLVVLTRGGDGASGWTSGQRVNVPAAPLERLVDTVGAGDTFMATLLAGLAQTGRLSRSAMAKMTAPDIEALLKRAGCAAALNCGREGCDPPTLAELEAKLSET